MKKLTLLLIMFVFFLTSCSVFMAAKKEGVSLDEINTCKTRTCLISKGAILIDSKKNENGELIETFNVQKPTGSTGRAVQVSR